MNVAGAWATFFAPFHLARFSFVPVVSVRLFLSSSERKRKMEEKVESDDDEDSVVLILCQRHLLSVG